MSDDTVGVCRAMTAPEPDTSESGLAHPDHSVNTQSLVGEPSSFWQVGSDLIIAFDSKHHDATYRDLIEAFGAKANCRPFLLAVVSNTNRAKNFSPPYEQFGKPGKRVSGQADRYLAALEQELIPRLQADYQLSPNIYWAGHSWGAAFVAYVMSESYASYQGYFMFSPTVIYRDTPEASTQQILDNTAKHIEAATSHPAIVYMNVGLKEPQKYSAPYYVMQQRYQDMLTPATTLVTEELDGAGHMATLKAAIDKVFNTTFCP